MLSKNINKLRKKILHYIQNYILFPGFSGDPKQYECNSQTNSAQWVKIKLMITAFKK